MTRDRAVAALADQQHGIVTLEQALICGFTPDSIRRALTTGRWHRVRRGIFAIGGAPSSWHQIVLAAVLVAGPEAVASHSTAAELWGLPFAQRDLLEVSTARPRRARPPGLRVHRSLHFLRSEQGRRERIPVTSVARTIVDLSGRFSVPILGRMTDFAIRQELMGIEDLRRCASSLPSAPGRKSKLVERVLIRRLPGYDPTDSDLEVRILRAIVGAGLPEPIAQHPVTLGRRRCRIDFAYPEVRLAIEVDGFEFHRDRSAFDGDRARGNDLVVAGWHILRLTSAMSNAQVVATIAAGLAALGRKRGA